MNFLLRCLLLSQIITAVIFADDLSRVFGVYSEINCDVKNSEIRKVLAQRAEDLKVRSIFIEQLSEIESFELFAYKYNGGGYQESKKAKIGVGEPGFLEILSFISTEHYKISVNMPVCFFPEYGLIGRIGDSEVFRTDISLRCSKAETKFGDARILVLLHDLEATRGLFEMGN